YGIGEGLTVLVILSDDVTLWGIRDFYSIEEYLCHAGLELLPKAPLSGGRIGSGRAYSVFSLTVFILIIGVVQRDVNGKVGVVFNTYSGTGSPCFGSDHNYPVFCPGAVKSRSSCSFQDRHGLYVVRVDTS